MTDNNLAYLNFVQFHNFKSISIEAEWSICSKATPKYVADTFYTNQPKAPWKTKPGMQAKPVPRSSKYVCECVYVVSPLTDWL
jgi:hypothetical protein